MLVLGAGIEGGNAVLANDSNKSIPIKQSEELTKILIDIGKKYEVYFSYEATLLEGVEVHFKFKEGEPLKMAIDRLLLETNLQYESYENKYFVIYEKTKKAERKANKVLRKFKQIDRLEKEGHLNVQRFEKSQTKLLSPFVKAVVDLKASISITGTVTDEAGEPLAGATILEKGTSNGTITEIDGTYEIKVADDATTLVISYIGYQTQEIIIGGRTVIDITLITDIGLLEEVVVVGYGTQKKINLTGAVDQVNLDKDIGFRPVPNITQMLQGKLPNLNFSTTSEGGEPGSYLNMNIRGVGTITGNGGTPYILLDGFPISASEMNAINPNDIESVSVLKDAASAAIYGSKGAYGVILITTKKGKKGSIVVDYSSNFAWASPTIVPEMANSLQFATAYNLASKNAGQVPDFDESELQDIKDYLAGKKSNETEPNTKGNAWRYYTDGYANNEWYSIIFKDNVPRSQHRLSVSGGSDNTKYYLSGNIFQQEGVLRHFDEKYDKMNFTASVNNQTNEWLSFDFSTKYSREETWFPSGGFGPYNKNIIYHQVSRMWPMNPYFNADGQIVNNDVLRISSSGGTEEVFNRTILQLGTSIEPIENWNTRISYNFDTKGTRWYEERFRNFRDNPDGTTTNVGYNPDRISRNLSDRVGQLFNIVSSYTKDLGNHTVTGLIGYEQRLTEYQSLTARKSELITPSLPTISTSTGEDDVDDALSHWSTQGVFARLNYNFNDKYLVEVNARYDGSSYFSDGNRWGLFPSISAAYNLSQEAFWSPIENVINHFKLRVSWGQLGNHDPNLANLYLERLSSGSDRWLLNGQRPTAIYTPSLISPNLTWETATTIDFGFDAELFNAHLALKFDWFDRTTTDMIGPAEALPAFLGTSAPRENNSTLKTRGFELVATWRDRIGDFSYTVSANLSDSKSTIEKYPNPTGILNTYREGMTLGDIWALETIGYFTSDEQADAAPSQSFFNSQWGAGDIQYRDLSGDNKIDYGLNTETDPGDRRIIGNSRPRFSYGLASSCSYKGFSLNVFLQGVAKRDYMFSSSTNLFWGFRGNKWQNSITTASLDYWTEENTDAYFPKPYMTGQHTKNTRSQTKYLQNAAYMRLKNVQLSYSIPKSLLSKAKLKEISVYFSGDNLLTFTKLWETFDPEVLGGAWGAGKIYPLQKVYALGLNIKL